MSDEASRRIGEELKSFYDGLVNEPLPDRFVRLLQQLEDVEKKGATGQAAKDQNAKNPSGGGSE